MSQEVRMLSLALLLGVDSVNCYLLPAAGGFVLVDTGSRNARPQLLAELAAAGCTAGALRLVVLTHGDFDHLGNAVHLRAAFGAPIAMQRGDWAMAEQGDMLAGRESADRVVRALLALSTRLARMERFTPDIALDDGCDLAPYGLDARVLHLPGHSQGSIGVLTADGVLFCGDLFTNRRGRPALNTLMDDRAAAARSLARLRELKVGMVYPGHGRPFALDELR